ncbi:MAG TPA: hypothetical protein VMJ32_11855 [Pirellulales bacterium]|nr:hypothetical protein [Pirellulales bacterium]
MGQHNQGFFGNRIRNRVERLNAMVRAKHSRRGVRSSKRARGVPRNEQLPFVPPENWHEPHEQGGNYRIVVQSPGVGHRHILTLAEVRDRLSQLPPHFVAPLEVVQFSRMTRKKLSFPCYGMQWGPTIYLYPVEESLVERFKTPPKPAQLIEARMYGGRWEQDGPTSWKLVWSELALKDYYLNNILIHELGHLLDDRNSRSHDRERFAEWFALQYGYKPTRRFVAAPQEVMWRHHKPRQPR